MDDDAEFNATPVRCKATEAIDAAARAFAGIDDPNPSAGIRWRLERAED